MTPDSTLPASAGIPHESAKYDSQLLRHGFFKFPGCFGGPTDLCCSTSKELYAVCAHLGGSMERGHYVAFVNTGPSLEEEVPLGPGHELKVNSIIALRVHDNSVMMFRVH